MPIRELDVIGIDSEEATNFVRHLGLADEAGELPEDSASLRIIHMGPPLERAITRAPIRCVGTLPVSRVEILLIREFVARLEDEIEAANLRRPVDQYCIVPHVERDQIVGGRTVRFRRFNCGGFVLEAYRSASIQLLDTDEEALPQVSLALLKKQYPDLATALDRPAIRKRMGLVGQGPWPVVLCGYVLNALDRTEAEIRARPYKAEEGDELFPPRRTPSTSY
ncbi:hypothetical protein [Aquisphaera giovannonii]|uniref:hypothetical protein n=1 Tax=Aquisphaera giovannonii TaxID=406548 RepID=UPI0011DFF123|nr:hypothetical protein [Aquisphaera giovannonii]